jgi:hypothetical protein
VQRLHRIKGNQPKRETERAGSRFQRSGKLLRKILVRFRWQRRRRQSKLRKIRCYSLQRNFGIRRQARGRHGRKQIDPKRPRRFLSHSPRRIRDLLGLQIRRAHKSDPTRVANRCH